MKILDYRYKSLITSPTWESEYIDLLVPIEGKEVVKFTIRFYFKRSKSFRCNDSTTPSNIKLLNVQMEKRCSTNKEKQIKSSIKRIINDMIRNNYKRFIFKNDYVNNCKAKHTIKYKDIKIVRYHKLLDIYEDTNDISDDVKNIFSDLKNLIYPPKRYIGFIFTLGLTYDYINKDIVIINYYNTNVVNTPIKHYTDFLGNAHLEEFMAANTSCLDPSNCIPVSNKKSYENMYYNFSKKVFFMYKKDLKKMFPNKHILFKSYTKRGC